MRTQIGMSATTIIIGKTLYKIKMKIKNEIVILHPRKGWDQQNIHAVYVYRSGCICLGIAQYIDAFLLSEYGDQSIQTTWNFDEIGDVVFGNMMELADTCGQSRLWGGMHFMASVPKSYELCDGVGTKGYERLMLGLLGRGRYSELMDASKEKFRS